MANLVPTVYRLAYHQEHNTVAIKQLIQSVGKINLSMGKMRTSNLRLADTIEKLIFKIDKMDQLEDRLSKLECATKK